MYSTVTRPHRENLIYGKGKHLRLVLSGPKVHNLPQGNFQSRSSSLTVVKGWSRQTPLEERGQ